MLNTLRLPLSALFLVALLAGFAQAFVSWWGQAAEGWNAFDMGRQLVEAQRIHQNLDAQDAVVMRCSNGKFQVTGELLAGRLTMEEAVEHFRRLEAARDEELGRGPTTTGPEREEELYRMVLDWANVRAKDVPDRRTYRTLAGESPVH